MQFNIDAMLDILLILSAITTAATILFFTLFVRFMRSWNDPRGG